MTNLTKKTFDNLMDMDFKIKTGDETHEGFSLIEIKSINSQALVKGQCQPFSLLFQTNNENIFEQGTYTLENNELNEIVLFLVPVNSNETGVQYEAVFT